MYHNELTLKVPLAVDMKDRLLDPFLNEKPLLVDSADLLPCKFQLLDEYASQVVGIFEKKAKQVVVKIHFFLLFIVSHVRHLVQV